MTGPDHRHSTHHADTPAAAATSFPSNIEIAQRATMLPIGPLAHERLGYRSVSRTLRALQGEGVARLRGATRSPPRRQAGAGDRDLADTRRRGQDHHDRGLGDALNLLGKRAIVCLREPALGGVRHEGARPAAATRGGADGGHQPAFHRRLCRHRARQQPAAALIDNHIYQGNQLGFDVRRISWRRVVDVNDRVLRQIVIGLGGTADGVPREDGFDIVVASEVMAILCLADSLADLRERLGRIVVGYRADNSPILARELKAHGAMTALLKTALAPNLVQTLENNPAFIHGGPFANIAHGCNSVIATRTALKLADYVVTEAGFGADSARRSSSTSSAQGGLQAQRRGDRGHRAGAQVPRRRRARRPQERESRRARSRRSQPRATHRQCSQPLRPALHGGHQSPRGDTEHEVQLLIDRIAPHDVRVIAATHFAHGGRGALELAREVVRLCDEPNGFRYVYEDDASLWDKMKAIATKIYHATDITADSKVRAQIRQLQDGGYGHYPVCVAKTQYSFSTDPKLRGAPAHHVVNIREVRLAGARNS